ncbi:MAG: hypothetical protein ACPGNT_04985 [Rhodospirillales bacterium]
MTDDAAIARALGYPYNPPTDAFCLTDGTLTPLPYLESVQDRWPVIAAGSNQSPEQLTRKFDGQGLGPVYAVPAWLSHYDCVYSAHITAYGSIPATLWLSPGTRVRIFLLWLDEAQLTRLHATEALGHNYDYGDLSGLTLEPAIGPAPTWAGAYLSLAGALAPDGEPFALAEIPAEGRRFPALGQRDIQAKVRALLREGEEEPFIRENIASSEKRAKRRAALADHALRAGARWINSESQSASYPFIN